MKAYKPKYLLTKKIALVSSLLVIACIVTIVFLAKQTKKWKTYAGSLEDSQNIMVWEMDESCFDQIQNTSDGMIRLQIK